MQISANGLTFEIVDEGPKSGPALLLVPGLGQQLIEWPDYFLQPLLAAGLRVIRMDNRDRGLSEHLDLLGPPQPHLVGGAAKAGAIGLASLQPARHGPRLSGRARRLVD